MNKKNTNYYLALLFIVAAIFVTNNSFTQVITEWKQHDMSYPAPPVVHPGTISAQEKVGTTPSDAIILFDGTNLDQWRSLEGGPATFAIEDGNMLAEIGHGGIRTYQNFGDIQLHIEWATPNPPDGEGQRRGNNGVQLMGLYEVQILDSYKSTTFPDGQAASVYSQYPPMVNACRRPGEWQTYDMIFRAPSFDESGNIKKKAILTLFHNGILVHDHVGLKGLHSWMGEIKYEAHPEKLPLVLQKEPCTPVKFRNIWVRELGITPQPPSSNIREVTLAANTLVDYSGTYQMQNGWDLKFEKENNNLVADIHGAKRKFYSSSETNFFAKDIDFEFTMYLNKNGKATGMLFRFVDTEIEGDKQN